MGRRGIALRRLATAATLAVAATVGAAALVALAQPSNALADNLWLQACSHYSQPGSAFQFSTDGDVTAWQGSDTCSTPQLDGSLQIDTANPTTYGRYAQWSTTSPAGISIDSAWSPPCSGYCERPYRGALISCNLGSDGYQAFFQWGYGAGSQRIVNNEGGGCPYSPPGLANGTPINRGFAPTNEFGWYVSCLNAGGCHPANDTLYVRGIQLGATEYGSPAMRAVGAGNLYRKSGWIRGGGWSIALAASDPSGVCNLRAWLNGQLVRGPTSGLNRSSWVQCSAPSPWTGPSVDTAGYADGTPLELTYQAENAAGNWSTSSTSTTYVDNAPVDLTIGGPTSAPTTAGVQYLSATATAGPSGVGAIYCSIDGSAWNSEPLSGAGTQMATAQIPAGGLGSHSVACYAANSALDPSGAVAISRTRSWSIKIGEPVDAGITFAKVLRRCRRVGAGTRRHGHHLRRKLVCKSLAGAQRIEHVGFGHRVTVSGWLATADGTALSHVPVSIMTRPDNRSDVWRRAARVTTSADGSWTVRLRPGPSRLIRSVYAGGPMTQPATSMPIRTVVPARVLISIFPIYASWGHSIVIWGRVLGGHVPSSSQVLQLRVGIGHIGSVQGNPAINARTGRFRFVWKFRAGSGALNPWFAVATLREADYPYAPGVSKKVVVALR